jgi:hypothetical protein
MQQPGLEVFRGYPKLISSGREADDEPSGLIGGGTWYEIDLRFDWLPFSRYLDCSSHDESSVWCLDDSIEARFEFRGDWLVDVPESLLVASWRRILSTS